MVLFNAFNRVVNMSLYNTLFERCEDVVGNARNGNSLLRSITNGQSTDYETCISQLKDCAEELSDILPRLIAESKRGIAWVPETTTVEDFDQWEIDLLENACAQFGKTEREELRNRVDFYERSVRQLIDEVQKVVACFETGDSSEVEWFTDGFELPEIEDPEQERMARLFMYVGVLSGQNQGDAAYSLEYSLRLLDLHRPASSIEKLSELIDEESYYAIADAIDNVDLDEIKRNSTISFNKVFEARDKESGKELLIKVTSNPLRAKIESAANYYLSRNEKFERIIAKGHHPRPLVHKGLYITVQDKISDDRKYSAHHYVSALAMLHVRGAEVLTEDKVVIPEYRAKCFEEILEEISRRESPAAYAHMKGLYEDIVAELVEEGLKKTIHSDTKPDNLRLGRLLDLEGIKLGDPAIDLSLYFVESGIPEEEWASYVQTYLSVVSQETGQHYGVDMVHKLTKKIGCVALVPCIKELGGIYSRPMRGSQTEEAKRLQGFIAGMD
jgi:thiamine kinase-like enzyme